MEFIWLWLGVMFPLVFSPGPANLLFATSGASVGLRRSLPLLCGVDAMFILQSSVIGLGAGVVLEENPVILQFLQLIGALYLAYLARGFLKIKGEGMSVSSTMLGFTDGLIVQLFNAKGWLMVVLMYSLFSLPAQKIFGAWSVFSLIVMLAVLNISLHLVWINMGAILQRFMNTERRQRYQRIVYASALLLVAAWIFIDNSLWC